MRADGALERHAGILGLHMEGPYIAGDDGPRGARDPAAMTAASSDDFARRQDAAGKCRSAS